MNKNIVNFIATVVLAAVSRSLYALVGRYGRSLCQQFIHSSERRLCFLGYPFAAVFLYWAIYSFVLSSANDFTLAAKISELLKLGGNPYVLVAMTGIVGGIAAGVAGVFGKQISLLRKS